jgi:excisionase family DNA binding protein
MGWDSAMPSDDDGDYLSIGGAAEWLGVSVRTLQRWVRDGRIPSEVAPDGSRVLRRSQILKMGLRTNGPTG